MINKPAYYVSMLILLAATFWGLLFIFWQFYPRRVIVIETPIEVLNEKVTAGTAVDLRINYCKYHPIKGSVNVLLVDKFTLPIASFDGNLQIGCHQIDTKMTIPTFVQAGTYRLDFSATYRLNPVREYKIDFWSEDFEVVE